MLVAPVASLAPPLAAASTSRVSCATPTQLFAVLLAASLTPKLSTKNTGPSVSSAQYCVTRRTHVLPAVAPAI